MWKIVPWPFSLIGGGASRTTQEKGLSISNSGEITAAIDEITKSVPEEASSTARAALETMLPNLVGRTMQPSNRKLPVTYKVSEWQTETQRGRKGVQVPGILTLRVTGDSKDCRPAIGTDDYYFIWDKERAALKIARVVPYGEGYTASKHFDELWKAVARDSSLRQNEHGGDIARRLGIEANGGNISMIIFEKE